MYGIASLNSHPIVSNGEIPSPRSGHSTVTIGSYLLGRIAGCPFDYLSVAYFHQVNSEFYADAYCELSVFGGIPNTDEKCDESLYVLNVSKYICTPKKEEKTGVNLSQQKGRTLVIRHTINRLLLLYRY